VNLKGIPKVSDSVWRRHNNHDGTAAGTSILGSTGNFASSNGGMKYEQETEAVESWRQMAEFENRNNVNQPGFKYPKIEYNRMFNTKTANSN